MIRHLFYYSCAVALCAILLCATPSYAQVTTADILGTVTDPSGAIVPGAMVTILNVGTGASRSMTTTSAGTFVFTLLPIGTYSLTIELSGFTTFTVPRIVVAAGDRSRVDAKMQLGDISEKVEVTGETVGVLQTDTAAIGGLVTTQAVQDLPLSGRNVIMLVQLVAGSNEGRENSMGGGTRPDDRRQTSSFSVNGMVDNVNNFLIDGMDNNERLIGTLGVKPSIDALEEVKILTSNYSAEVGRTAGGVVNMITKSGKNKFSGTLFEFLRNDKFGAKDFFNVPQAGNPLAGVKPKYRQNQFGGSLGGPIIKNKTFFFGDYEGLRIVQGRTGATTIPTPCQLGRAACNGITQLGNFSELTKPIYDITTNPATPFTNNVIPIERLNPIALKYAALIPTAAASSCSSASGNCQFITNPARTQFAHAFDVRVDHHFGDQDSLYGRHSFNQTKSFVPGLLPPVNIDGITVNPGAVSAQLLYPGTTHQRQQQFGSGYTHVFRPTLLLQLSFGYLKSSTETLGANWGTNVNAKFGGPNVNISQETSGLANVGFLTDGYFAGGGGGGFGDNMWLPLRYWDDTYQGVANLTWVKGAHSFKTGGNLVRRIVKNFQSRWPKGNFMFSSRQTDSAAGGTGGTGGNSFASFLLGYPYDQRRELQLDQQNFQMWEIGGYIHDDWRATPWLTLNMGLRYDIYMPWTEENDRLSTFDPAVPSVLDGGRVIIAGQDGWPRGIVDAEYTHFQPRFGAALSLGRGMVMRGGFGMSYYPTQMSSQSAMKNQPFVANWLQNTPLGSPGTPPPVFGTGVPAPTASSTCLTAACGATTRGLAVPVAYALDHRDVQVFQYNFTLEKEFGANVMSVGYVGTLGYNINRVNPNGNLPTPPLEEGGCGVTSTITLPHPCQPYYSKIPLVSSITNYKTHDGSINYNGMLVSLTRRLNRGLTGTANYAWGHSLTDTGSPNGSCTGCGLWLTNFKSYDYGDGENDIRHRFTLTANYQFPFGQSFKGFSGQVLKGWQINGLFAYSTGQPVTVTNSKPQINNGSSTDRPDALARKAEFEPTIDEWFDTTAFTLQPWGTAGTSGRAQLKGPPQRRVDVSIFKDFPIKEGVKVQFRVETFNLTNTPSFATPGAVISGWTSSGVGTARPTRAGNFGRITATSQFYTPRDIQFALKLVF